MRPIDADALTYSYCPIAPILKGDKETWRFVLFDSDIDHAPTVDAVPSWIPCEERLPKDLEVVNITWVNHRPVGYYFDIKDKPFTATAIHYEDKWWWYSPVCEDLLAEYGKSECDKMDAGIEVIAWMPLPEPYKGERKDDE